MRTTGMTLRRKDLMCDLKPNLGSVPYNNALTIYYNTPILYVEESNYTTLQTLFRYSTVIFLNINFLNAFVRLLHNELSNEEDINKGKNNSMTIQTIIKKKSPINETQSPAISLRLFQFVWWQWGYELSF